MSYQQVVSDHHKLSFTDNVKMVSQQLNNPLRAAVTTVMGTGEAQDIADLIGEADYNEVEDYSRRNPENPPSRTRRWLIRPTGIDTGGLITKEEKFDFAMDPSSHLFRNWVKGVERGVFDRILGIRKSGTKYELAGGGILGAVSEGKTPTSSVSLPAGNYIASDYEVTSTHTGLTLAKMRAATEAMELEDFGLEADDEVYGLITPKQKTDLINLAVETGKNLNPFDVEQIAEGKPGKLLGINWIFTNRLPLDSSSRRLVPLWTKSNVVAGFWQDVEGVIFNDSSSRNLPRVIVDAYVTAGRVEDKGVRVIRCAES